MSVTSAVVVDDSAFMRQLITRTLEDGGVSVAGTAGDGAEALEAIKQHEPDVVTMDVEMPRMDGLEAVGRIMTEQPTPTLMLSAYTDDTADVSLEALDKGAVDVYHKPGGEVSTAISGERETLVRKVQSVAEANVARFDPADRPQVEPTQIQLDQPRTIVIGASTGGPRVVKSILSALPLADCRVLIVQHMPSGFTSRFADRLDEASRYDVVEADGPTQLDEGMAAVAPGDHNLIVDTYRRGRLTLDIEEPSPDDGFVPSVDVTMHSTAASVDDPLVGVVLSGMGDDGVQGLTAIGDAGGLRIAQAEADCAVFGMPRRAIEAGEVDIVSDVRDVPSMVMEAVEQ